MIRLIIFEMFVDYEKVIIIEYLMLNVILFLIENGIDIDKICFFKIFKVFVDRI